MPRQLLGGVPDRREQVPDATGTAGRVAAGGGVVAGLVAPQVPGLAQGLEGDDLLHHADHAAAAAGVLPVHQFGPLPLGPAVDRGRLGSCLAGTGIVPAWNQFNAVRYDTPCSHAHCFNFTKTVKYTLTHIDAESGTVGTPYPRVTP